ncbi:unnamed protein product [Alopecurus aequalis]
MKSLQEEAKPAQAKTTLAPVPNPKGALAPMPNTKGALAVESFTAREIEVAEQLIHLRYSSVSSGTPRTPRARSRRAPTGSGSSQALVPASDVFLGGFLDWEENEEHEVAGAQRRVKRYRLIKEIYAATEEMGGRTGPKDME